MARLTPDRNPFMLMTHPERVLAAVERSEPLGQLHRHLCRPLDRGSAGIGTAAAAVPAAAGEADDDGDEPDAADAAPPGPAMRLV